MSSRSLWEIFFSFGAIQGALIFLPLLAFPYLARVLQPEAFGQVMYLLTLAMVVSIIVEWGFGLGAVRTIATCRNDTAALQHIVYGVLGAKIVLALLCIFLIGGIKMLFSSFGGTSFGLACAVGYGIVLGFNPTWYYQGMGEGMRSVALWDVGSSALALGLMLLAVHEAEHSSRYILLLFLCKGSCYTWLNLRICRSHAFLRLSLHTAWQALVQVRIFFFTRLASLLYTQGNMLLAGNILPTRELGMLIASDKIAKAVVSISGPITQTLFPEVCALRQKAPHKARHYLRLSLCCSGLIGLVAALALWLLAPWIIYVALGPHYEAATPILRISCFVIPFLACNFVLGTQILVPFGQEQSLMRVLLIVGIASLPGIILFTSIAGVQGAACMPLLVEGSIFCLLSRCVYTRCPEALLRTNNSQQDIQ